MIKYLNIEDILQLHFNIIEEYGGAHGIRSEERLQSVIEAPQLTVFGAEQYTGDYNKAAVYIRNIIGDHPFVDGNKRTGITSGSVFLLTNGYKLTATPKQLEDFAVSIAVDNLDIETIASWLQSNSVIL